MRRYVYICKYVKYIIYGVIYLAIRSDTNDFLIERLNERVIEREESEYHFSTILRFA